jgi:phosphatidylserine decarboxylase
MRSQTLLEARWILIILIVLAAGSFLFNPWFAVFCVLLIVATLAFFRDPERVAPEDPYTVVAPADGLVADITEVEEPEVLFVRTRRIGIFLSVFDVHVNRAPIEGQITYRKHHEGLCLDARSAECAEKNEAMTWAFANPWGKLVVRQLTGAIARRIVGWLDIGDTVKAGDRFGMIRFGSRTEVYLPLEAKILVQVGDRVRGGETPVARLI